MREIQITSDIYLDDLGWDGIGEKRNCCFIIRNSHGNHLGSFTIKEGESPIDKAVKQLGLLRSEYIH